MIPREIFKKIRRIGIRTKRRSAPCLALIASVTLTGCDDCQTNQRTDTLSFESGEMLVNESYIEQSWDGSCAHNRLFYQPDSTTRREFIEEVWYPGGEPLFARHEDNHIARKDNRVVITVGPHLFKRIKIPGGPDWQHLEYPDLPAKFFLGSFLPVTSPLVQPGNSSRPAGVFAQPIELGREQPAYATEKIDLVENVLATRRTSTNALFPECLIYSGTKYDLPWQFDLERTRKANHLAPPAKTNLVIEVSVVRVAAQLGSFEIESREKVLQVSSAKEVWNKTLPLAGRQWTQIVFPSLFAKNSNTDEKFEAILGFIDPLARVSVFWRSQPPLWDEHHACNLGEWVRADASGFDGGSRIVYFKVKENQPESTKP